MDVNSLYISVTLLTFCNSYANIYSVNLKTKNMHRQENVFDNEHESFTNPADKQFTAEFEAGNEIFRYAIKQTLKENKDPMTEDTKELLASIGDDKVETWVRLFIYAKEIIKLVNSGVKLSSYREMSVSQKYRIATFNHTIKEVIKNGSGTSFIMPQIVGMITRTIYPDNIASEAKDKQMFRDEVAGVCIGMWHEVSMQNLLDSAGIGYVESTINEDANKGIDLFIDGNGKKIEVDVKSPNQHSGNPIMFHESNLPEGSFTDPIISISKKDKYCILMSANYGSEFNYNNLPLATIDFDNPYAIETITKACSEASRLARQRPKQEYVR